MRLAFLLTLPLAAAAAHAQWTLHDAHTTADLRGIDTPAPGVAWASGSNGTILRSEDAGFVWQLCAIPPGAEKLDFRGIQAFDNKTAIVMSSGKGSLSRLYKTTDGCQTWKKVFDDPDPSGFFDALHRVTAKQLYLLGDPVNGKFSMFTSRDGGDTWLIADDPGLESPAGAGAFAASNSSLTNAGPFLFFGTGGTNPAVYAYTANCLASVTDCPAVWNPVRVPMAHGADSTGVYSLAGRFTTNGRGVTTTILLAVGGDYKAPEAKIGTGAWTLDSGEHWNASTVQPLGYRSSVAYDRTAGRWIAVGPSGTDVSTDDGRTWHALTPAAGDPPDANLHWNALALPYAVGPHGRIGTLHLSQNK